MSNPASDPPNNALNTRPGWDALLLALLTVATLQVNGFAQAAALPTRVADVMRHPWLGGLLPQAGLEAMGELGPIPGDPIGLLLNALTLGGLLVYLLVDLLPDTRRLTMRLKWLALSFILLTALFLPTAKLILLRAQSGPASYTHDGGVIQTEATIEFLFQGRNPYIEDYVETPMAEWGFGEFRTALYHYPYLPWTFIFSAPFYALGQWIGFYDQRLVYLALMVVALTLARRLAGSPRRKLAIVAILGLNPVMNLDLTFGQNDAFVLCWLIFSLVAWRQWWDVRKHGWLVASALCFGLACASKPTAWFFAPFYGLLLLADMTPWTTVQNKMRRPSWGALIRTAWRRGWPSLAAFALVVGPYLLWNPMAFYDDVWRWSAGRGETGYQIWGWGASNFVLALGWVEDRFDQWPFLLLQAALTLPIMAWLLVRQWRTNTLANACWHGGLLLLIFFYGSRFLNENYLGYILSLLALGTLAMTQTNIVADEKDERAPLH